MYWIAVILGGWIAITLVVLLAAFFIGRSMDPEFKYEIKQPLKGDWQKFLNCLQSPKLYPVAGAQCRNVEVLDRQPLNWVEDLGSSKITYHFKELQSTETRKEYKMEASDCVIPMKFTGQFQFEKQDNGILASVTVRGRIEEGTFHVPFFRIIVALGGARLGMASWINRLGKAAQGEGGEHKES